MKMTAPLTNRLLTGKTVFAPSHLQKYLTSWACPVTCIQLDEGYLLTQQFENKHYTIQYTVLELKQPVSVYLNCSEPVVALHYMLKGTMCCRPGEAVPAVLFEENKYRPFYLPAGTIAYEYPKGISVSLHFEFAEYYPHLFANEFDDLKQLALLMLQKSRQALMLSPMPINYSVHDLLYHDLLVPDPDAQQVKQKFIIYNLFWLYHSQLQKGIPEKDPGHYREIVQQIMEEIRKNPNKEVQSHRYFARKYLVTEATLRRVFKALSGITLADYRYEQCMLKALYLVKEGRFTLEEIALEVGYGSKSSLSTSLKVFNQKSKQQ